MDRTDPKPTPAPSRAPIGGVTLLLALAAIAAMPAVMGDVRLMGPAIYHSGARHALPARELPTAVVRAMQRLVPNAASASAPTQRMVSVEAGEEALVSLPIFDEPAPTLAQTRPELVNLPPPTA